MNKILFSSERDNWETPEDLFNKLNKEFEFTIDVASSDDNYKVKRHYTIKEDGLKQNWDNEIVWCNPPYGREIEKWVEKAVTSKVKTAVLLLPARTDTRWFHKWLYNNKNVDIRFLKGRIKFVGGQHSAPFPSMVCIIKGGVTNEKDKR